MTILESPALPSHSDEALSVWHSQLNAAPQNRARVLLERIRKQESVLTDRLVKVYGQHPNVDALVQDLIQAAVQASLARAEDLWQLDLHRQAHPDWHQQGAVGYTAYVDQFAGNLQGITEKIDYLKSLGVTYLHLLPFFKAAEGPNDGGFAVAHFEEVAPTLGTQDDLLQLTQALRKAGISLCSDFILNHVAQDHEWALKAKSGDLNYQNYFCLAKTTEEVAAWEKTLPQIFPDTAPGNFTFQPELNAWVWTTFYPYQWDLNYANPKVFLEVVSAMMRVANMGIEAFRLDSTGFLWKRIGTNSQNQPEVHCLLQALRALMEIACPGVLLKAEAIMPTQQLPPYFGLGESSGPECHLAYHSSLMAASWVALAEQDVSLLRSVMAQTPKVPQGSSWLSYVRCHDDIGWNVLKPDLEALGDITHERLIEASQFFAGMTEGSYARGAAFQTTHTRAVHGTNGMASALTGLDSAHTPEELSLAIDRLLLLQGLSFFMGGLPLLYMGDELGLGNTTKEELGLRNGPDGRELHRPYWSEDKANQRHVAGSMASRIFSKIQQMAQLRKIHVAFKGNADIGLLANVHPQILGLQRNQDLIGLFNFSNQAIDLKFSDLGLGSIESIDSTSDSPTDLRLNSYQFMWINIASVASPVVLIH
jgi:amylosucrase